MHRVAGYRHRPGDHCGSTSLRNLADFYGWGYDEAACLGLGAGLGFTYFETPDDPWRAIFGRPMWLETAFFEYLGVDVDRRDGDGWAGAWTWIRDRIDGGDPVMVFTDLYHLDYYGTDTHFSPHSLLAVGYGDGEVLLSDSEFADPQRLPVDSLRAAMTTDHLEPLRNRRLAVTDPDPDEAFETAAPAAIRETARYMLDPGEATRSLGAGLVAEGTHGVEGIRAFARDLPSFVDLPDPAWAVRFAYQNVERRGTGGGAFRRLYADFLDQAGAAVPEVPGAAGDRMHAVATDWSAVGDRLRRASERDDRAAMVSDLEAAADDLRAVADREAALYRDLLEALA